MIIIPPGAYSVNLLKLALKNTTWVEVGYYYNYCLLFIDIAGLTFSVMCFQAIYLRSSLSSSLDNISQAVYPEVYTLNIFTSLNWIIFVS